MQQGIAKDWEKCARRCGTPS